MLLNRLGNDHLRLPDLQYIFGIDVIRLVHGVIADKRQLILGPVTLEYSLINDPFIPGNDDIGVVTLHFIGTVYLIANDDGSAWCRQHGIAQYFKCPVITAGKHRQGERV